MKKIKNEDKVNAYQARKVAGEVDFAAQDAELAMFKRQPSQEKYAMEKAQWLKEQRRTAAKLARQAELQIARDSKPVSVKVAHKQAIAMDAKAKRKATKAFAKMEAKYGKWFDNQKHANPAVALEIDNRNAELIMSGASWEFMVWMIQDNPHDDGEAQNMETAIGLYKLGEIDAAKCYHIVNSLGNIVEGNMKLFGKLHDTLVDMETFKWSDHKQYVIRIVAYMTKQVQTKFIAERLAEYNVVDKMVRDARDYMADKKADAASTSCIAPSYKAINDDVLRTLALSY